MGTPATNKPLTRHSARDRESKRKATGDQRTPLTPDALATLWADLDSQDAIRAWRTIETLGSNPTEAVRLIQKHLDSLLPKAPVEAARWIKDLDNDGFEERERATKELARLGDRAEPALQKLLAARPSVEAKRRAEALLRGFDAPSHHAGRLRELRLVPLLEQIGTAEAREMLEKLAKLPADDQRSLDAKAGLRRLARRQVPAGSQPSPEPQTDTPCKIVVVDEVRKYLKDPKAPVRPGKLPFGVQQSIKEGSDRTRIVAIHQFSYNGFTLGYVLRAYVAEAKLAKKELAFRDLSEVEIAYTDDMQEARGLSEKDTEDLVQLLYKSENKVEIGMVITPGGELLRFSSPMRKLIMMGDKARYRLEQCLADPRIQDQAALVLGTIGNERSVTLLIDAYPPPYDDTEKDYHDKSVFLTFALSYLTCQEIGRSRLGADCNPENRKLWMEWWAKEKASFRVSPVKPNATWVPGYPILSEEWAIGARKQFVSDSEN
jgi:hypothetical protein